MRVDRRVFRRSLRRLHHRRLGCRLGAQLASQEAMNPKDHVILPTLISKEPLGPMVRRVGDEWFAVVKLVIYGLLETEEYGITHATSTP